MIGVMKNGLEFANSILSLKFRLVTLVLYFLIWEQPAVAAGSLTISIEPSEGDKVQALKVFLKEEI